MKKEVTRLYFIDAIRAWAILMMLQGHFVDGLLDNAFRDNSQTVYSTWKYFRGMTAPVFFTVSGFIFTYLLIKVPEKGLKNPRVKKGFKRGLELLLIGYVLRMNLKGLLSGQIYKATYLVDVLHCIGISIIGIIVIYLLTEINRKYLFPLVLLSITISLFIFEPIYSKWTYSFLPEALANYFTKNNGSVFTVFPWIGYTTFGAFASILFHRYKSYQNFYRVTIAIFTVVGLVLIFLSSDFFMAIANITGIRLFSDIFYNNYLFIRLGDVLIAFAIFMLFRQSLTNSTLLKIGQSTLSIYVIHFMILYGSLTGLGLYQYYNHSLSPVQVILGAIVFMIVCSYLALQYEKHKSSIKQYLAKPFRWIMNKRNTKS